MLHRLDLRSLPLAYPIVQSGQGSHLTAVESRTPQPCLTPTPARDGVVEKPPLFALLCAREDPLEGSRFPAKLRLLVNNTLQLWLLPDRLE